MTTELTRRDEDEFKHTNLEQVSQVQQYRSTPLNASAFGVQVTLDSSVKIRAGQQTKSTSPGRLQFGVIIYYNKIKR